MNYIVGEVVSPDYVPMMLQEININRTDKQELNNLKYCYSDLEVLIIGAGMSGILAGIRLAELGIKFKIYEKNINSTLESPKSATIDKYSITNSILHSAKNLDLVGILSSGSIARGYANSMGQFNWHDSESVNFDWSIYTQSGKAIKKNYSAIR